jgi:hypothetical protein
MKTFNIKKQWLLAYNARRGVTYEMDKVPSQYSALYAGSYVWCAVAAKDKRPAKRLVALPKEEAGFIRQNYLGIAPEGSFSFI